MKLVNHTPWSHVLFERGDAHGRRFTVLVFQGVFAIDNGELLPLPSQPPVPLVDQFLGDPSTTGLARAGAIATQKPRSDVSVLAFARASRPLPRWNVSLRIGQLQHALQVRGLHHWWRDDDGAWQLSEPEPCTEVPLVYERAFGGRFEVDGEVVRERRNPLGTGFLPDEAEDLRSAYAPQVVGIDEPEHEPGQRYVPRGWAPIPSYYAPRCDHLGTVDETWRREQWPKPPLDFSDAYYQSAHPDLIYPGYLRGDEAFRFDGVSSDDEPIEGRLPGCYVFGLLRLHNGYMFVREAVLDTLHLDLSSAKRADHRAFLTWRLVLPKSTAIRVLEGRMVPLDSLREARPT